MLCIIIFGRFGHFGGISSLLLFTEKVLNPFFVFLFFVFFGFHLHFFCIGFSVLTNMKEVSDFALVSSFQFKAKKNVPKKRKYKL